MVIGIENLPKNTLVSNSYEDSELYDEANHSSEMQYKGHARYDPPPRFSCDASKIPARTVET